MAHMNIMIPRYKYVFILLLSRTVYGFNIKKLLIELLGSFLRVTAVNN